MPGKRASRAKNLFYGMLMSQLLTTGLGATAPEGTLTLVLRVKKTVELLIYFCCFAAKICFP